MKTTKSLLLLLCTFILLTGFTPVKAEVIESSVVHYYDENNISPSMDELDPYVVVKNNQFVLELPSNVQLSEELHNRVATHLNKINQEVDINDLYINPYTKTVHDPNLITPTAYGYNAVYFHWNYLEFRLDAGLVQNILTTGIGAIWAIAGVLSPVLVAHPVITIAAGVILTFVANAVVQAGIQDGIVVHFNFFYAEVTYIGRQ